MKLNVFVFGIVLLICVKIMVGYCNDKKKKNFKVLELNRIKCKKKNIWGGMVFYYKENGEDVCIYEKVIVLWFSRYNIVEKIY